MFIRLGVDKPVSSTQMLADIIEHEVEFIGMRIAFNIANTTKSIIEFDLSPKSQATDKTLLEYDFPGESRVVMITRADGKVVMPHGNVSMKTGDKLLMICDESLFDTIWKTMVKK